MRSINVSLPEDAVERLRDLARRELRDTRAQAAVLLLDGLARAERRSGATRRRELDAQR